MKIPCPIRHRARWNGTGFDRLEPHDLVKLRTVTQQGTGHTATWYECPTGRYRWFILDNDIHEMTPAHLKNFQYNIPHWGWKKD